MGTMKRTALPMALSTLLRPHSCLTVALSILVFMHVAFKPYTFWIGLLGLLVSLVGFAFVGKRTDSKTAFLERSNMIAFALLFMWMVTI